MKGRTDISGLDRYIGLGYSSQRLGLLFDFPISFIRKRKDAFGLCDAAAELVSLPTEGATLTKPELAHEVRRRRKYVPLTPGNPKAYKEVIKAIAERRQAARKHEEIKEIQRELRQAAKHLVGVIRK